MLSGHTKVLEVAHRGSLGMLAPGPGARFARGNHTQRKCRRNGVQLITSIGSHPVAAVLSAAAFLAEAIVLRRGAPLETSPTRIPAWTIASRKLASACDVKKLSSA